MVFFDEDKQKRKLSKFRQKEEERLAKQKARSSAYSYIDLAGVSINTDALQIITEPTARATELVAFNKINDKLRLAARHPDDQDVQEVIERLKKNGHGIDLYVASPTSLKKAYSYYQDISQTQKSQGGEVDLAGDVVTDFLESNPDRDSAVALIKKTIDGKNSTSKIVEVFVAAAIALGASDVHIEVNENSTELRLRIDGVLQTITEIPEKAHRLVLSRIKLLSGMKLNITKEAQDGRFSIRVAGDDTEIRSSIVPSAYGESIVMRVLSKSNLDVSLEDLGMQPYFLKAMRKEINRPKGLVLNTGPTGSGKTTTLYSFLKEITNPQLKTITIENPIEYHLDGIVQTQVEPEEGYGFYDGLEAAMRQDPDIMMVGEIRNDDTAKTAMHAGLTGHRVLSTLHTNDASGTFPRLVELGVDRNLIESALNVAMAQRLVRKLCPDCKQSAEISGEAKELIDNITKNIPRPDRFSELDNPKLFTAKESGCESCGGSGYRGRVGVFEAIIVDETVGNIVRENPSSRKIFEHAQEKQGMLSMAQDGILKVLAGDTDIAELKRVIDIEKALRRVSK